MPKHFSLREKLLALAIAIVFAFFIGFGINVFSDRPEYNKFCKDELYNNIPQDQLNCEQQNGKWISTGPRPVVEENNSKEFFGWCDIQFQCREDFEKAEKNHAQLTFIITLIAGLLAIIIGIKLKVESVSLGLMGGGILTILYGLTTYLRFIPDLGRFILVGVVLAVLIYLGYKKFRN